MAELLKAGNRPERRRRNSRRGCTTCKIRHLKCDEAKPICKHCRAGKWDCEYTEPAPIQKKASQASYALAVPSVSQYRPSLAVSESAAEQRSFNYFHCVMAYDNASCFEFDTWYELVLQVSRSEPALLHSIYAFGSLLEEKVRSTNSTPGAIGRPAIVELSDDRFSLQHYTKAVSLLSEGLSTGRASHQTALMVCLLFICIELLQHRLDAALHHLQGGLKIIRAMHQSNAVQGLDLCIQHAFTRLNAQARMHGSPTSNFNKEFIPDLIVDYAPQLAGSLSLQDVADARRHLDILSESACRCGRQMKNYTGFAKATYRMPVMGMKDPREQVENLQLGLRKWKAEFTAMLQHESPKLGSRRAIAVALLQLQEVQLTVVLDGLLAESEMMYDSYNDVFEQSLMIAESVLDMTAKGGFFKLSLDPDVIPLLFVVALKCRNVALRGKAISLLRLAPEREGIWHRDRAIAVAEWKLQRERVTNGSYQEDDRIHCERGTTEWVDGKAVTVMRFKKGDRWQEEGVSLVAEMGDML